MLSCRSHLVALIAGLALLVAAAGVSALPTNNDPANQIRFDTVSEANAKRDQLINYIWSGGLPTTALPSVTANLDNAVFSGALNGINPAFASSVSRLDANVSNFDFHSISYLLRPSNDAYQNRVVILHQGHSDAGTSLDAGVSQTANALLQQGFTVNVMQMPLFGWNTDRTANIPGQGTIDYGLSYDGHASMILNTGPVNGGMGFRLYLEPIIQSVNYAQTFGGLIDISMIGISGGGWSTHLAAALDPRISLSVPVAGAAPLYVRNADPNSVGDVEQYYSPMFDENIASDGSGGGLATWLEIFALGGYGAGRRQIYVTNEFDSCCFSGTFADSFDDIVSDRLDLLGAGDWDYFRDSTSNIHQIAPNTLTQVIMPSLGIVRGIDGGGLEPNATPEPGTLALAAGACASLLLMRRRRTSVMPVSSPPR